MPTTSSRATSCSATASTSTAKRSASPWPAAKGHSLGAISVPRGKQKNDEFLGLTEVIYDQVDVSIPIISADGASSQFALAYEYQGCVEDRICYPPIVKYLSVDAANGLLQVVDDLALAGGAVAAPVASCQRQRQRPDDERVSHRFRRPTSSLSC